jgi:hypothetical protein
MTKGGTEDGLELTSGLVRKKLTSTNEVDLVTADTNQNYGTPSTSGLGNKIYIKNTGTSTSEFIRIGKGVSAGNVAGTDILGTPTTADATTFWEIGRLYGGEWLLMPWDSATNTGDITVQPSSVDEVVVEWMVFFEE